jgi:RES domain-containing protein
MEVYRIAKSSYRTDLTGLGARLYGARWNRKGTGLIYTSESRALASLEFLVHVPLSLVPPDLKIISIDIPRGLSIEHVSPADLPANWRSSPAPAALADFGSTWAKSNKSLLLRVPSAIIDKEFNILINPDHPDRGRITINKIEDYEIDSRLLRGRGP